MDEFDIVAKQMRWLFVPFGYGFCGVLLLATIRSIRIEGALLARHIAPLTASMLAIGMTSVLIIFGLMSFFYVFFILFPTGVVMRCWHRFPPGDARLGMPVSSLRDYMSVFFPDPVAIDESRLTGTVGMILRGDFGDPTRYIKRQGWKVDVLENGEIRIITQQRDFRVHVNDGRKVTRGLTPN